MAGRRHIWLLVLCTLSGMTVYSQTLYIKAGQVFNGREYQGSRIIVINNGVIKDLIDPQLSLPDSVKVIDASDCTVLPGLIDSHTHFMGASLPYLADIEKHSFGKLASEGISLFPQNRLHLLMNGITSVIDMGAPLKSYKRIINAMHKGKIVGPELYYPGPLITAPQGHPAGTYYTGQHDLIINGTFQVSDTVKAEKEVKWLVSQKVDFIKIVYDRMWYLKNGAPRLEMAIAKKIVVESHKSGLKVIAHVGSETEAREMAGINVDGIEHGFGHTSDTVFTEISNRKISFTPTLCAYDHYAPSAVPFMKNTVKRARELNIPIIVGTDYPASYGRYCGDDIFREMNLLEEAGVPRIEVLKGATYYGAEKIGRENEIGCIAIGSRANLILFKGLIDSGKLTSSRITGTMLHGRMIIKQGLPDDEYSQYFKSRKSLVFPYGFYDLVSGFNTGLSYTNFDILGSGISLYSDASRSVRNMWSANLQLFLPGPVKKTSLKATFHYDNLNRLFYGIGNETRADSRIEYGSKSFEENISATTSLNKRWKLMYSVSLNHFRTEADEITVPGSDGGSQTLVSLSLSYDTRDHQNNPWTGLLISLTPQFSPKLLGSTLQFSRIAFDARGYLSPIRRNILCARILYRQAFGDVPYYFLPDFGGSVTGRGYYFSRFIDRAGIYAQAEYRFAIWSIISGTAFYDAGQVQKSLNDFKLTGFHQSFGFGPRFSFGSNENSILGMNVGVSNEGVMVSFSAGHAF